MTPRVEASTILLVCAGVTVITASSCGLRTNPARIELAFALAACATWCLLVTSLARARRELADPSPLTPATWLTLARGLAIAVVAGFATIASPKGASAWAPGLLYALAAIGDGADGALARRTRVSRVGARLDVTTDAVGLFVAPLAGVRWGRLPPWYLALAGAYPLFRLALFARRALGLPTFADRLAPDPRARFFAGVQMTVVAAALFPVLPAALTWTAATLAMLPTLALFAREWQVATSSAAHGGARAQRLDA